MALASNDHYEFGDFTLDIARASLRRADAPIALRPKSFDLLHYLAANAGRVATRDELMTALWPKVVVTDDSLTRCISDVRAALGDHAQQMLRTVSRRGYLFAVKVTRLPVDTAADVATSRHPQPSATSTATALRTNLPDVLLPLIGREQDLAAAGALIAQHRLVTIVGPGGVGKSRLAQWLLHERRDAFEHGVAWVDLAPLADPALLPGSLSTALGLNAGGGEPLKALLASIKPLRLVIALDNAEHLVDAVAQLAQALHDTAPHVHVIVTSQTPLKIAAETVYRLNTLTVPDAAAGIEEARSFSAVALFAQRAHAADARFAMTAQNAALVVNICRRLDGLPLAIEMAAAHAPWLGLARLAAALDERFRALKTGNRDLPPRHKTLRAAMEWSHALLDDGEQIVFRRLGVFAGSFSLELAQRILAGTPLDRAQPACAQLDQWQVLQALGALIERSLLATDGGDAPRYRLLETPRAFAIACLHAAGETAPLQSRHAAAYRTHFEHAYQDYFSGRQLVDEWRNRLLPDLDDGRAALAWSTQHDAQTAVSLAATLAFLLSSESPQERRRILLASQPLVNDALPPAVRARWTQEFAFGFADAQPALARTLAAQAVAQFRLLDDRLDLYRALGILVYCLQPIEGQTDCPELAEIRAIEDPAWPPVVLAQGAHAAACWHSTQGEFEAAIPWRRKSLELYERAGHTWRRLVAQANLLDSLLAAGRVDEAIACGVDLQARLSGTRQLAALPAARLNLAAALLTRGDTQAARALAIEGWPQGIALEWQPYWADYLALLAALEARPRAASLLLGYADARYAALGAEREVNEARAADRAAQIALAHLGSVAYEQRKREGALLRDDEIAPLAFAVADD